jgi:hypothetical protein
MTDYRKWLASTVPRIDSVVLGLKYPIEHKYVQPFRGIAEIGTALNWLKAYNCVKHSDMKEASNGNLGNALNAIAALAVLYEVSVSGNMRMFDGIGFIEPQEHVEKHLFCSVTRSR